MQYLVSVIDDKSNPGSTDRQPAISAFNERLIAEGYWVFAGGLADTHAATVIDNRGEQAVFSDGPFVESKEYLAGVWVMGGPRSGCGAQARRRGVEGLRPEDRGAAVPVSDVDVERRSPGPTTRSGPGWSPP